MAMYCARVLNKKLGDARRMSRDRTGRGSGFMYRRTAFLLGLSLLMIACGSGDSASSSSSGSLSGNWLISLTKAGQTKVSKTLSGSLVQNSDVISGTIVFTDRPCTGVSSVNGNVSASTISLAVDPVGTDTTLSGSVGSGQTSMTGNYTILSTGCTGPQAGPETGTFAASLVTPLSGNITTTFSAPKVGTTPTMAGKVSQGANTGASTTPLTGNVAFTGGFCYTSANIVGSISGTSVVMNLADSDGVQVGQLFGTSSIDGTSVAGTFQYLGLGPGASKGCADGDSIKLTVAVGGS
jgi:hypothetical protein